MRFHARGGSHHLTSSKMTLEIFKGSNPNETYIFTKKKKRCSQDSNTGPLVPKSAMVAPRPPIDENCLKNMKNFDQVF